MTDLTVVRRELDSLKEAFDILDKHTENGSLDFNYRVRKAMTLLRMEYKENFEKARKLEQEIFDKLNK